MLIHLEIRKGIDKERDEIFADAVKQTMRKMQPSSKIASGSQQEGLASSAPKFNDAASDVSVNTVVPVPQDDGAASEGGSQQEGLASSAPQDNDAGSEMSVNTVAPVPQDDGAASEASVNTVVTDNGWIHFEQTDENAPTGLNEEADASG